MEIPGTRGKKLWNRFRSRAQKIRMRSRPATGTALVVCSCAALSPRMRRHDRFSVLALPTSAASAKASRRFRYPVATFRQLLRRPAALLCFDEQVRGRRPQRPGNQPRHRFWMFSPRQSALADYRLPPALPQLSGKLRNSHVSLPLTLNQFVAPGNIKRPRCCEEAVEDNTCLWKVEEN